MRRARVMIGLLGLLGLLRCQQGRSELEVAVEDFLKKAPGAFCSWLVSCGKLAEGELDGCAAEIQAEVSDKASCKPLQELYQASRAAADACLAGEVGACGTDDFGAFCPPFKGVDLEKLCAVPDGGPPADRSKPALSVAQAVVGAWHGSKTCDSTSIEYGYLICPKSRLNGYEKVGGYSFLDCGTWSVTGDRLALKYKATAVADPTSKSDASFEFTYQASSDTLTWVSKCPVVLKRLVGETKEEDCTSATCTAGGTGPITGCNIDCDCGRCWYCEKGTCRYGGEGPYGCFRGCGP